MDISKEFKQRVVSELLKVRENYTGPDHAFARQYGLHPSVFSQLKQGKAFDGLIKDTQWLNIARELGISPNEKQWNTANTDVFKAIQEDILFCKEFAKAMILVDECAIGKTYTARYLSKQLKNCFYVDCSQYKTKQAFIRGLARTLGIDASDKYIHVKANIKYYLKMLEKPIIILDEAGDLEYMAFLELKELWNATEGYCGWYMMGADGLRAKIERGIQNKKVGFKEIFSRYSDKFLKIVPIDKTEKIKFYQKLISDVIAANVADKNKVMELTKKCMQMDPAGNFGGLRRAESLLLLTHTKNK